MNGGKPLSMRQPVDSARLGVLPERLLDKMEAGHAIAASQIVLALLPLSITRHLVNFMLRATVGKQALRA